MKQYEQEEPRSLEQVLVDAREELNIVKRHGSTCSLAYVTELLDDIARAAEPYLTWLSETDAILRSGKSSDWLRSRFALWSSQGLARWSPMNKRARQYRELIVPVRPHLDAVRARARRAANEESAA